MSTRSEKLRVFFLTFIMIVSVAGVVVAFSGGAMAADNTVITQSNFDIQAGGADQAGGGGSISFSDSSDGFDSNSGTATIQLPTNSDITFDEANSTLAVGASNIQVSNVRYQGPRSIAVDISNGNDDTTEAFTVNGIKYKAPATVGTTETITASFGAESATVDVSTVGLSTALDATNIVRGAENAGPAPFAIEAEGTAETGSAGTNDPLASGNTQPFVASGDNITVTIDSQFQDRLSFDKSSSVSLDDGNSDEDGDGTADNEAGFIGAFVFTDDNTLKIEATKDIPNDAELEFDGLQFNTTGVTDDNVDPEFSSALDVTTTPKFGTGSVSVKTGTNINTQSPTAQFGTNIGGGGPNPQSDETAGLAPGVNGQPAPNSPQVEVIDDSNSVGGEIATGAVTIEIPDGNGIEFDQSQTVEVESSNNAENSPGNIRIGGSQSAVSSSGSVSVSAKKITIDISQASNDGDKLLVGKDTTSQDQDVNPLDFNVSATTSAQNVNLTVKTSGGASNVTQNTSTGAEGSSYDLDVAAPAFATNDDNANANDDGNNLTLLVDANGETGVNPDTGGQLDGSSKSNDVVLTSGSQDDISTNSRRTNITLTLPSDIGVTFDTTQEGSLTLDNQDGNIIDGSGGATDDGTIGANDEEVTIVDNQTINITLDASGNDQATPGDDIVLKGLQYNVTSSASGSVQMEATINRTSVVLTATNIINSSRVAPPDVVVNDGDKNADDGGTDLTLNNDDDGETQVDPGSVGENDNDFVIGSNFLDDIASTTEGGTNLTISLPGGSPATFDQSQSGALGLSDGDGSITGGSESTTIVDDRTLVITIDQDVQATDGDDIAVTDVQYNLTAGASGTINPSLSVNRTGETNTSVDNITVTSLTEDQIQGDAENDGNFGSTGNDEAEETTGEDSGSVVGSTQTGQVEVKNSTQGFDFGGASVDLAVTDSPSGASASLNTTSVTTEQDGTAGFNVTLGSETGTYNVTASLARDSSINVTMQFNAAADAAAQVNVTQVKDAIAGGTTGNQDPTDAGEAIYRVRIEDDSGNIVTDTSIDASIIIGGDAQFLAAYGEVTSDLSTPGKTDSASDALGNDGDNVFNDGDNDARLNYIPGDESASNQPGEFFLSLSDSTEEPASLEVNPEATSISSDSASAEFFQVRNVDVSLNNSDAFISGAINATSTITNGNGDDVTVPNITASYAFSNGTVASFSSTDSQTDFSGTADATITADAEGTTDVESVIQNKQGVAELTVSQPTLVVTANESEVTAGQSTGVRAQVTYQHNSSDAQGATVNVTGANVSVSDQTTPADGNVTFTVSPTEAGTITVNATKSNNNRGQTRIDVVKQTEQLSITANETTVTEGDTVEFNVTDSAGAAINASVTLDDGTDLGFTEADGLLTRTFNTAGDFTATANKSDTDTIDFVNDTTDTITVQEPTEYTVSGLDDATVQFGDDPINFTVDVENTGDIAGNQTINLSVTDAGTEVLSRSVADVELDGGENQTVTFVDVDVGSLDAGDYNTTVSSDDTSVEGNLTVESQVAASVTFDDQTVTSGTEEVIVDSANFTEADGSAGDYVVVVHVVNATEFDGGVDNSISAPVGASENRSNGAENITVDLNSSAGFEDDDALDSLTENVTLRAMLHTTDNDSAFGSRLGKVINGIERGEETDDANITVQEPASFSVSDLSPVDATVDVGEEFDVSATITNDGDLSDTQDIELRLEPDGNVEDTESVQLDGGENQTVTFENVSVDEAGEFNHTVASADDSVSGNLTVESQVAASVTFNDQTVTSGTEEVIVDSADFTEADGSAGDYVVVVHTIDEFGAPVGNVSDPIGVSDDLTGAEQNITVDLTAADGPIDSLTENVTLRAMLHTTDNDSAFGSRLGKVIDGIEPGDETDDANITVQEPASFSVSDLTPVDATVDVGEEFDVSATITNDGDLSDTQDIELRLEPDGDAVRNESVQLDGGESQTVTFENVSVGQAGEFNHTVASADASVSGNLTVESQVAASVTFNDQTVTSGTEEVIVDSADFTEADGSAGEYVVVVHTIDEFGAPVGNVSDPIGASGDLTGAEQNITVDLTAADGPIDSLTENVTLRAMLHTTDNDSAFGSRLGNAIDGIEPGEETDDANITVQEPASFSVSDLTPVDATVDVGEEFDVSATITNDGDLSDTQEIELRLEPDGDAVRNESVQLDGGESQTVTFESLSVDQAGEFDHTVASADDSVSGNLTVESQLAASVTFDDQTVTNGDETVTVANADYTLADGSAGDYVVVVHIVNDDGSISSPVGYSSDVSGDTDDITVDLNASEAQGDQLDTLTEDTTLRAMLHETSSDSAFGSPITIDDALVTDDANITVEPPEIDVTGNGEPATDTTGDGLLNDVDGDGDFDILDVQALFNNFNDISDENAEFFDFNDDGDVNIFDVQALFEDV